MKGDFSFVDFDVASNYTSVRHQQGRVLLDRDWNDAQAIDNHWRQTVAGDAFGMGVLAVPSTQPDSFKVLSAVAPNGQVQVELAAGRAWASGLPIQLEADSVFSAEYVAPAGSVPATTATIVPGVTRDLVLLEVFEDTVCGFQDPSALIEPALGGPDTTERVRAFSTVKLLRLGADEDCSAVGALVDDPANKGRLTVSPSPSLAISGDCPLEIGGGYTGLEHFLYRIEIAEPRAGRARFKWSQFNGGLSGRGVFVAATNRVTITANDQAINTCGVPSFYLEALDFDATVGAWMVRMTATANRVSDGVLALTNMQGAWPAGSSAFFRLWNGIDDVLTYATGAPANFVEGLQLTFDPPAAGNANYRPGDYWTFPVRAGGAAFASPLWPAAAPPTGVVYRRVALGIIRWQDHVADWDRDEIDDCRRIFRPLTNQKICCSFIVGDGRTSFGDFNSIELALRHLPYGGGEICLLPGTHTANAVISNRRNVTIRGCGARTVVMPRDKAAANAIFTVVDSTRIEIEHMDLVALGGLAIDLAGTAVRSCDDIAITRHRILAFTHAVRAREVSNLTIAHNRIRMLDKQGGLAAIDVEADDTLIERNEIKLVPAEHTPPVDPTDPEPIDPVDPCAPIDLVHKRPIRFRRFLEQLWNLKIPLVLFLGLAQPYRALGGIQVRNGSERVRILENQIVGGAGNGITLGALVIAIAPPAPQPPFEIVLEKGMVMGHVFGPNGNPLAGVPIVITQLSSGAQKTLVSAGPDASFTFSPPAGTYGIGEAMPDLDIANIKLTQVDNRIYRLDIRMKAREQPQPAQGGFLYEISIERNDISAMGLNGIGTLDTGAALAAPPAGPVLAAAVRLDGRATLASRVQGTPVIGLAIRDNRIVSNLRNPFTPALRDIAAARGLGGISLGLVDDLAITGNRIERNGPTGKNPACGVFVQYGEAVEIARNVILDNGPVPGLEVAILGGVRGGIVLRLAANLGLFAALRGKAGDSGAYASAARVLANHVEQPVGCALLAHVFGPIMIDDNVFASERSAVGGIGGIAGTVAVVNLAGVQETGPGVRMKASMSVAAGSAVASAVTQPVGNLTVMRPLGPMVAMVPFVAPPLPLGSIMFNDNQTRAGAAHSTPITQLLMGYDDVSFEGNQSHVDQGTNVMANTMVRGGSLRAIGNRLRERSMTTALSLFTVAERANVTSLNQADHCIVARTVSSSPPNTVGTGNQVLFPSSICAGIATIASTLFMPEV